MQWVRRGLRTGIKSTRYPARPDETAGLSPGLPRDERYRPEVAAALVARCPTGALRSEHDRLIVDRRRCVHAYRCARQVDTPAVWTPDTDVEWAATAPNREASALDRPFARSVHVIVVDAGDCGACLHEVKQLNNPYYNMHRLGFFLTPTPRHADVLIVVGPVTDHMRVALKKTYDAMPTPKRVIAVGACALSGGVFGPSFVSEAGVGTLLPVDVEVPGQPPPPLAILHALLVAVGRRPAAGSLTPGSGRDHGTAETKR